MLLTKFFKNLVPLRYLPLFKFSKQRLIQFTPKQVQYIHSKSKPKMLNLVKPLANYYTVCIIGLPNSGKSTLYNCIAGENLALTDNIPGMTRDRKQVFLWDGILKLVDTAGVETNKIHDDIMNQTVQAYNEADKILFVIDGKRGINDQEIQFSKILKQSGLIDKVLLVVNKMQSRDELELANDIYKLGFKDIMYTSGEQGNGVLQLMQHIHQYIPQDLKSRVEILRQSRKQKFKKVISELKQQMKNQAQADPKTKIDFKKWERQFRKLNPTPEQNSDLDQQPDPDSFMKPEDSFGKGRGVSESNPMLKKAIQISIIGRPNVGKSSLINKILGENRMAVSEVAHTTTDSITNEFEYQGRKIKLIDTAGLNSSNFDNNPEHLKKTQVAAMNHVKFSHVVVYMIDSDSSLRSLDFLFIKRIIQEGRPVILTINKWETIKPEYKKKAIAYINKQIETHLGELNGMPLVTVSAIMEEGIEQLLEMVLKIYDQWNLRVSTGMLNNWLEKFSKLDNLPKQGFEDLRIRFLVQAKVRPPTFIIFVNNKNIFKQNYSRFMKDKLVNQFKLQGIPIRFIAKNAGKQTAVKETPMRKKYTLNQLKRKQKLDDLKQKYGNFGQKQ